MVQLQLDHICGKLVEHEYPCVYRHGNCEITILAAISFSFIGSRSTLVSRLFSERHVYWLTPFFMIITLLCVARHGVVIRLSQMINFPFVQPGQWCSSIEVFHFKIHRLLLSCILRIDSILLTESKMLLKLWPSPYKCINIVHLL